MVNPFRLCISNFDTMKKFLLKVGLSIVYVLLLVVVVYLVLHGISEKSNDRNKSKGQVFVWGDSQMYQGLDVSLLSEVLGEQALTSAGHGAGVYDFLVSEKSIPCNSKCVLSFSEAALLRNPLSDYNRTGFELSCLKEMYLLGCPLDECVRIAGLSKRSIKYSAFGTGHSLYAYADSIVYREPLSRLHSLFEAERDWFFWKARAYKEGLRNLYDKQSQLVLVQFPFDKQVETFACYSINRHLTDSLKEVLIRDFALKYEEIVLESDSLLMHDLSHMNEIGARLSTIEIADILRADTVNNYFIKVAIR